MLTDSVLKHLKGKGKPYKVTDRDGMYAYVSTTGTISFRYDYVNVIPVIVLLCVIGAFAINASIVETWNFNLFMKFSVSHSGDHK